MNSHGIRAIILDLGGVLLDWNPRHLYQPYFDTPDDLEAFLAEINFPDWNAQQDGGRSFAEGVAVLSAQFPHREALIRAYRDNWERSIAGPIAGSVKLLRRLKAAGYPVYGLTNWSAETYPIALSKYDFLRLLDFVLVSGEAHLIKPDPRIFQLMLERIHLPAPACLFVDDSPVNVSTARELGFLSIRFHSPEDPQRNLVEHGIL